MSTPDPQPGEFWMNSKGRNVEILARDAVQGGLDEWDFESPADVIAFRFTAGTMVHLRSVRSLRGWVKVDHG